MAERSESAIDPMARGAYKIFIHKVLLDEEKESGWVGSSWADLRAFAKDARGKAVSS
jgi:hypothetical protein